MLGNSFNFVKKFKYTLIAAMLTLAVGTAGAVAVFQPDSYEDTVSAANCDNVNIVHCGFNGPNANNYVNQFKHYYKNGSDGRYNDLKQIYRWAGAGNAMVNNMNTNNTKVGTLHDNGNIYVGGKKVGYNAKMAARFRGSNWTGVVHIKSGVWARNVTPAANAYSKYKVLVHFDKYGQADFAVAVGCGNAVKFTPVPKKPVLVCKDLNVKHIDGRKYRFTVHANAKHTTITSYTFRFSDGHKVVRTHKENASVSHAFAKANYRYSGSVVIDSTRKKNVTSKRCNFTVKTPRLPAKLVCKDLNVEHLGDRQYRFTAQANASRTKITSYVFHFGDGQSRTVKTSSQSATTTHTFAQEGKSYQGRVVVNSVRKQGVTSSNCAFELKTPAPKPSLVCKNLTFKLAEGDMTYKFTANAQAKNTKITSYVFNFGDGESQTVNTSSDTASATHTYSEHDKTFNAFVLVNGTDQQNVTSDNCKVTVKTPKQPVSPELVCAELSFQAVGDKENTYQFNATASAKNTQITSYVFKFGDSESQTVFTANESAQVTHTYANNTSDFTATVLVNSKDFEDVTSANCKVTVPAQPTEECKPGVPVGSPECKPEECKPGVPEGSPKCEEECKPGVPEGSPECQPEELPNTGAGSIIGFFGATTLAGGLIHRYLLRQKARA